MTIRSQAWRLYIWLGQILALPCGLFLFFQPDIGAWTHTLRIVSYIIILSLGGSGVFMAIFIRTGIVQLIYSDADKQTLSYKMSRIVAEREHSQGRAFSDSYYENLGVKPPKQKESDDKPTP
jgi:hypothetical protein